MVAPASKFLGTGLYTVAEAALYARVSSPLMRRWLFGTRSDRSVIDPEYGAEEKRVSFLDLVQTLAIREIRLQHKVPLEKFRQAIAIAKRNYDLDYPFARAHCTFLLGDELVICPPSSREQFMQASGRQRGQFYLAFVEMYLTDLTFDANGLAEQYLAFRSKHERPITVTMDPKRRFGEPLLPSGYSAHALWEAIQSEGGQELAAEAYGVPLNEVEAAYQYFDHLGKVTP